MSLAHGWKECWPRWLPFGPGFKIPKYPAVALKATAMERFPSPQALMVLAEKLFVWPEAPSQGE